MTQASFAEMLHVAPKKTNEMDQRGRDQQRTNEDIRYRIDCIIYR